ncbi:MAG: TolB family protein [Candidatus Dormibacteraceae bacterium]
MSRLGGLVALLLMVVFGFAVYVALGHTKRAVASTVTVKPPRTIPFTLPGTIVIASAGQLYQLQGGTFKAIGSGGAWSSPALTPDGQHIVAVKRGFNYSNLYLLGADGTVQRQLTNNQSRAAVAFNLWAFYPRVSVDGKTIVFSSDKGKNPYVYTVDLSVWSMPVGGGAAQKWSQPSPGTGGDVEPAPLANGGVIYTKFGLDPAGLNVSTIVLKSHPYGPEVALTQPGQHCQQPVLNADGTRIAAVCQVSARVDAVEVWQFDGQQLVGGPLVVFQSGLAATPAWSPDGTGLIFLAPGANDAAGNFQLWYSPLYGKPKQLTTGSDFDAQSAPAWKA